VKYLKGKAYGRGFRIYGKIELNSQVQRCDKKANATTGKSQKSIKL